MNMEHIQWATDIQRRRIIMGHHFQNKQGNIGGCSGGVRRLSLTRTHLWERRTATKLYIMFTCKYGSYRRPPALLLSNGCNYKGAERVVLSRIVQSG